MRDSDHAPHFHRPEHFYRTQRGAQNRGNPTPLIEERLRHSRPTNQREVMFVVTYEGGRLCYTTVRNRDLCNGDSAVLRLVAGKQETGELPAGTIVGLRRVH
jgi:hypothetical protein